MKVDYDKIRQLIDNSSNVVIMGHKNLDLDALGSALGMYVLANSLGKMAYVMVDETKHELGVSRVLKQLHQQKVKININGYKDIKKVIDEDTLLIIVDVHISSLLQNEKVLNDVNKVIILDHHVVDKCQINNIYYKYIEDLRSSVSEIVTEILENLNVYIHPYIATVMLAGIVIDTNNFFHNTDYNTYDAASYLTKQKADRKELQYLIKEDMDRYIKRQKLISKTDIIDKRIAICTGSKTGICYKEDLAKISDRLLLFNGIEAGFTIAKIARGTIGISARSLGNINVQQIMEKMDGGGHMSDAATQLKGITIEEAKDKLLKIIYNR